MLAGKSLRANHTFSLLKLMLQTIQIVCMHFLLPVFDSSTSIVANPTNVAGSNRTWLQNSFVLPFPCPKLHQAYAESFGQSSVTAPRHSPFDLICCVHRFVLQTEILFQHLKAFPNLRSFCMINVDHAVSTFVRVM